MKEDLQLKKIRNEERVLSNIWLDFTIYGILVFINNSTIKRLHLYICRESKEFIDLFEHSDSDDVAHTH